MADITKATPRPWTSGTAGYVNKFSEGLVTGAVPLMPAFKEFMAADLAWREEATANAALIVQAVNERDGLIVANKAWSEKCFNIFAELERVRTEIHKCCPTQGCRDGMVYFSDGKTAGSCEWRGHALGGHT